MDADSPEVETDVTEAWQARMRELTIALVQTPSITNTPGETAFATRLHDLLGSLPCFMENPAHLRLEPTIDDRFERANLFALVRGSGPGTVVLTGHYDVVGIEPYGALQPWAFDPEALLPRLIAALEQDNHPAEHLALADLRSGDFLPGRGMLDMKSGLAAGIAVLERFAALPDRRGNLLLLATPDEEEASHGMRSAALQLGRLARAWELRLEAAINLDASDDQTDGSQGRAVFLGSVGKLLPSALLVGRETHAGSPFAGINATLLASELARRVECNVDLVDSAHGDVAPPPVTLKQSDLKTHYDVTTPSASWCYFNVLTLHSSPQEVLRRFTALASESVTAAIEHQRREALRYAALRDQPITDDGWQPLVMTVAELQAHLRREDPGAQAVLDDIAQQLAADPGLDTPAVCARLVAAMWVRSSLRGPAAVVGFAGLHYPRVDAGGSPRHARLEAVARRHAATVGGETGYPIRVRPFFQGISDMSFLGGMLEHADIAVIAENTPAWGTRLRVDYQAVRDLDLPVINIGPWGRDYHQRTERVHVQYAFNVVPELVWRVAKDLLDQS
jgi:arginine utilization protein RocB